MRQYRIRVGLEGIFELISRSRKHFFNWFIAKELPYLTGAFPYFERKYTTNGIINRNVTTLHVFGVQKFYITTIYCSTFAGNAGGSFDVPRFRHLRV